MLITLILLGVERLINALLAQHLAFDDNHIALTGKTIRINLCTPDLKLDMYFCDDGVRFLPVDEPIFEQLDNDLSILPDCIISFSDVNALIRLIKNPYQSVNLSGNHQVWQHMQHLLTQALPILNTHTQLFGQSFKNIGEWVKATYFK